MSGLIDVSCVKVEQQQEEADIYESMSSDMDIGPIKIEPELEVLNTRQQENQISSAVTK